VLDAQQELRRQLERNPVDFFQRTLTPLLETAREALAQFIHADNEGIVFVPNATAGVNTVLKSLKFRPSDELLVTQHEYNACKNALDFVARRDSAKVVVVDLPFPVSNEQEFIDALMKKVTPLTRLALIDHVTSPTALILPIQKITAALKEHGIEVLVDGAHATGMLDLNMKELDATYYTGNCHKWLCAPKTSAFLHVAPHRRNTIRPLSISHGANARLDHRSRFQLEFDWQGTSDPTSILCIPAAIAFFRDVMPGGWATVRARNHQLVLDARNMLCEQLAQEKPAPDHLIGSMATVPLPDAESTPIVDTVHGQNVLQAHLFNESKIEVPIVHWPHAPTRWVRLSAQLYNSMEDYEKLAAALSK
jgi:isopenicillin-N epimerase